MKRSLAVFFLPAKDERIRRLPTIPTPPPKNVLFLQCRSLKLELDDAKASCELQKARVKDLVASKVSTILDGGGAGDNAAAATPDPGVDS